jgi:hypothetical protein
MQALNEAAAGFGGRIWLIAETKIEAEWIPVGMRLVPIASFERAISQKPYIYHVETTLRTEPMAPRPCFVNAARQLNG